MLEEFSLGEAYTQRPKSSTQSQCQVSINTVAKLRSQESSIIVVQSQQPRPSHAVITQAVKAELTPKIPIPQNADTKHKFRLCVRSSASPNRLNATLAMIPAVTANMPP